MSARARVSLVVGAIAAAAAAVTVGATLLTASDEPETSAVPAPRPGAPPLVLDLGVRTDGEARDLRRGAGLYQRGRREAARAVFARHRSVEAEVAEAMASWPSGAERLRRLADSHPERAVVQVNGGLARFWLGDAEGARRAWRAAKRSEPDTLYAVRAGDLLHPEYPVPGLPVFVQSSAPGGLRGLAPPAQLRLLARRARTGGVEARLAYGVALQRLSRPRSAAREFAAAAALAPDDAEALTAAAVGRFDKDDPSRAFSRLGPLARRYPASATVRFHLGLLLLWLGRVEDAKPQLRRAVAAEPGSVAARQARAFLDRLG